jgi:hypothetical protein
MYAFQSVANPICISKRVIEITASALPLTFKMTNNRKDPKIIIFYGYVNTKLFTGNMPQQLLTKYFKLLLSLAGNLSVDASFKHDAMKTCVIAIK